MPEPDPLKQDENFTYMVTKHALFNPFQEETDALKSRAPGQLLSHESVRLNRLTSFNTLFREAAPQYHVAATKGNWAVAAVHAQRVLQAAKAVAAAILLMLCCHAPARAGDSQAPFQVSDTAAAENFEYVIGQLNAANSNIAASSATAALFSTSISSLTAAINNHIASSSATTTITSAISFVNTTFNGCFSGSTVTFYSDGVAPQIFMGSGSFGNNGASQTIFGVLVDGRYIDQETRTDNGLWNTTCLACPGLPPYIYTGLSAGSHSVCWYGMASANTGLIAYTGGGFHAATQFSTFPIGMIHP